jgi:hypothetical protein
MIVFAEGMFFLVLIVTKLSLLFLAIAQQALCIQEIFYVLKKFLLMKSSTRLQTLSCYLLICLMTNNGM